MLSADGSSSTTIESGREVAPSPQEIPFTQYLMPRGIKSDVRLPVDDETYAKAVEILQAGFAFEVEMLSDYRTISATITHSRKGDLAFAVCPNGPEVPVKIKEMILNFKIPRRGGASSRPLAEPDAVPGIDHGPDRRASA